MESQRRFGGSRHSIDESCRIARHRRRQLAALDFGDDCFQLRLFTFRSLMAVYLLDACSQPSRQAHLSTFQLFHYAGFAIENRLRLIYRVSFRPLRSASISEWTFPIPDFITYYFRPTVCLILGIHLMWTELHVLCIIQSNKNPNISWLLLNQRVTTHLTTSLLADLIWWNCECISRVGFKYHHGHKR